MNSWRYVRGKDQFLDLQGKQHVLDVKLRIFLDPSTSSLLNISRVDPSILIRADFRSLVCLPAQLIIPIQSRCITLPVIRTRHDLSSSLLNWLEDHRSGTTLIGTSLGDLQ